MVYSDRKVSYYYLRAVKVKAGISQSVDQDQDKIKSGRTCDSQWRKRDAVKRSEKPEETREAGGDAVRTREDGFNRQRRSRERKNREKKK